VGRLTKLLEELLNLSRIQAGSIPLNIGQIAFKLLINDTFELLSENAKEKNITLVNDITDDFVLIADLDKIDHIIQNLIENGIRYNKEGGKVIVSEGLSPNTFIVQDTGKGIAPENISQIFGRFKRFNKEIPGTGLGLAIVKSIVDLHGGQIKVNSELEKGTSFTIQLPDKGLVRPIF
ncbi:MAG TPA: HAMP domain-containing sensor histidine kinase, partial [Vampirovibrionales bacterium]